MSGQHAHVQETYKFPAGAMPEKAPEDYKPSEFLGRIMQGLIQKLADTGVIEEPVLKDLEIRIGKDLVGYECIVGKQHQDTVELLDKRIRQLEDEHDRTMEEYKTLEEQAHKLGDALANANGTNEEYTILIQEKTDHIRTQNALIENLQNELKRIKSRPVRPEEPRATPSRDASREPIRADPVRTTETHQSVPLKGNRIDFSKIDMDEVSRRVEKPKIQESRPNPVVRTTTPSRGASRELAGRADPFRASGSSVTRSPHRSSPFEDDSISLSTIRPRPRTHEDTSRKSPAKCTYFSLRKGECAMKSVGKCNTCPEHLLIKARQLGLLCSVCLADDPESTVPVCVVEGTLTNYCPEHQRNFHDGEEEDWYPRVYSDKRNNTREMYEFFLSQMRGHQDKISATEKNYRTYIPEMVDIWRAYTENYCHSEGARYGDFANGYVDIKVSTDVDRLYAELINDKTR